MRPRLELHDMVHVIEYAFPYVPATRAQALNARRASVVELRRDKIAARPGFQIQRRTARVFHSAAHEHNVLARRHLEFGMVDPDKAMGSSGAFQPESIVSGPVNEVVACGELEVAEACEIKIAVYD